MSSVLRLTLPAVAMLLATGCMSTYHLPAGKPAASLRVSPGVTTWICADSAPQMLRPGKDGRATIPAGERVTIGANFATSDGYTNQFCSAAVSLSPEALARYHQDFEYEGGRCRALVYRETEDKRVGLAFERSVGKSGAGCTQ